MQYYISINSSKKQGNMLEIIVTFAGKLLDPLGLSIKQQRVQHGSSMFNIGSCVGILTVENVT